MNTPTCRTCGFEHEPQPEYGGCARWPSVSLASCGHPRDEDGECGCSSWPERALDVSLALAEHTAPALDKLAP